MMKTIVIIALIVVSMLTVGGIAVAKTKGMCHGPEGRMNRMMERVSNKLNLDENQKARLDTLSEKLVDMRKEIKKSHLEMRQVISEMLAAPQLDRAKAQSYLSERETVWTTGGQEALNAFAEFSDSLSAEQRAQLIDWVENFRQHRFDHSPGHL